MTIRHKSLSIFFPFFMLLLSTWSCQQHFDEEMVNDEPTFVSFSTRAQGNTPSINADVQDYEDAVLRVRLIICQSGTGAVVYNALHAVNDLTNYHREIEIKKGSYDCYIIANETASMTSALASVTFQDALWQLPALSQIPIPTLSESISSTLGVPMVAHVQANVTAAHTKGHALRLDAMLIRTLAKMTLKMQRSLKNGSPTDNSANLIIKNIKLINIPTTYSLFPPKTAYSSALSAPVELTGKVSPIGSELLERKLYIPEYLCANTAGADKTPRIEVTYGKHGIERQSVLNIDQINFPSTLPHFTLMANSGSLSKNSIVRNTHYVADVQMDGWDEEALRLNWKVLPWNKKSSVKQFAPVSLESPTGPDPQLGVKQSAIDAKVISIDANEANRMTLRFKIRKPEGAVWRFNLTNHLDFRFTQLENSYGIASDEEIQLTIETTKPWNGYIRTTELYLTINGKEVQIVKNLIDKGEKRVGPTFRYLIRQTS